jgi:hypothetical protein
MSHMGKSHLVIMVTVGPDDVAEGDRIFASHGQWMKGHPREGDVAHGSPSTLVNARRLHGRLPPWGSVSSPGVVSVTRACR